MCYFDAMQSSSFYRYTGLYVKDNFLSSHASKIKSGQAKKKFLLVLRDKRLKYYNLNNFQRFSLFLAKLSQDQFSILVLKDEWQKKVNVEPLYIILRKYWTSLEWIEPIFAILFETSLLYQNYFSTRTTCNKHRRVRF